MHGMAVAEEVLSGARRRAAALAARDEGELRGLLHPRFVWTSHAGERFDLESYLASNLRGSNKWAGQLLADSEVTVVGDTAVLRCTAMDRVDTGTGAVEVFVTPMTQVLGRMQAFGSAEFGQALFHLLGRVVQVRLS